MLTPNLTDNQPKREVPCIFTTGDQVVLKSGGPCMTVEYTRPSNDAKTFIVHTSWFVNNIQHQARLLEGTLDLWHQPSQETPK